MKLLARRALGPSALIGLAFTVWLGIWVTPPDAKIHQTVRLLYIHPAVAWIALYVSFGVVVIASALYLWPRTRSLKVDLVVDAGLEISIIFIFLTLVTGSIWGRASWGIWWGWDARLTTTAIMGVLELGILALRRANDDPVIRARRSAVLVLVSAVNVPIIHFSVVWWATLHQGASVLNRFGKLTVHGSQAWTLLLSFISFTLAYGWMLRSRYRISILQFAKESVTLTEAIESRRAEGATR